MTYNFIFKLKDSICHEDLMRINEKKQHLLKLRQEGQSLRQEFEELSTTKKLPERLKLLNDIEVKRIRLDQIRARIQQLKAEKSEESSVLETTKRSINETSKRIAILREKIDKALKIREGMTRIRWDMGPIQVRRMENERAIINDLCSIIFEIVPSEATDPARIAERETVYAYVNGSLMTKNQIEPEYRIVRSLLPADGNYKSYLTPPEVVVNEMGEPVDHEAQQAVSRVNTINHRSVVSGLALVSHLVNLLAFYTNTLLPYNLPLSIFSQDSMDLDAIMCAIAKLNTNVIYLSLHRGFQVGNLIPERTVENLLYFLKGVNKMEIKPRPRHPVVFPDRVVILLENMFKRCNICVLNDDWLFKPDLPFDTNDEEWEEIPSADMIPCDDGLPTRSNSDPTRLISSTSTSSLFNLTGFVQYFYPGSKPDNHSSSGPQ